MLSLNGKRVNKQELLYYNLIEQNKMTLEELSNIDNSYSMNYSKYYVNINNLRAFIETGEIILETLKENFIKYAKLMCNAYIELGTDIKLSDGNTYHFSLSIEDQQNIKSAIDFANLTQSPVPYHADGELCKMFSVQDINKIYAESIMYITYQTTYFNMLKHCIQNCDDAETIIKSYYLMELPEEYNNKLNDIITQSRDVVSTAGLQKDTPEEDIPQEIKPEDNLDENTSENISDENTQEDIPKQEDIPNEEPIEEYIQENESNENELQEGDVNEQA